MADRVVAAVTDGHVVVSSEFERLAKPASRFKQQISMIDDGSGEPPTVSGIVDRISSMVDVPATPTVDMMHVDAADHSTDDLRALVRGGQLVITVVPEHAGDLIQNVSRWADSAMPTVIIARYET